MCVTVVFLTLLNSQLLVSLDYLFFRAILLLIISILIVVNVFGLARGLLNIDLKDLALFSVISFSANWFVYGLIPFNVSRSNSVILIGYLNSKNGALVSKDKIESVLFDTYFRKNNAVEVRLTEQVFNGAIERVDNEYRITKSGAIQVKILSLIANFYAVKNNFLSPDLYEQSDE